MADPSKFDNIHNATGAQKSRLLAQMDVTMVQKLAFASAHLQLHDGARILDVGCANGKSSYHLAALNPHLSVIGVDYDSGYIAQGQADYKDMENLSLICADVRQLDMDEPVDGAFISSVTHEISSFNGYGTGPIIEFLAALKENTRPGGILLLRDFMRHAQPDSMVYLDLPPGESKSDDPKDMSYPDLLKLYARIADTMKPDEQQGFFLEEVGIQPDGWHRFYLPADWAYEFIWRKEYRDRFVPEAREKYAPMTAEDYQGIAENLGMQVVYRAEARNPWIQHNWYDSKFRMFDSAMKPVMGPPSNYFAILKVIGGGEPMRLREHRASDKPPSYLKRETYKNKKTGGLYDLVSRPGNVYDVIPYGRDGQGNTVIYAKAGYPRPIPNIHPRQMSPNIDGKHWAGFMVEPLAVANEAGDAAAAARKLIALRTTFNPAAIAGIRKGLDYFTAPAEVNEKVSSVFVELSETPYELPLKGSYSGFSADGSVRAFEIQDLLRGVQVGMLPEARLEMNIYALMRRLSLTPRAWIGDTFSVAERTLDKGQTATLGSLQRSAKRKRFVPSEENAGYLKVLRSIFLEETMIGGKAQTLASQELEFAVPDRMAGAGDVSTNSVMTVPLVKDAKTGEMMIGLQVSDMPAVQAQDGHSGLITIPGYRLPSAVTNLDETRAFLQGKYPGAVVEPLGEGYFPSMGILPNRVFPWFVSGAQDSGLKYVSLREVFKNIEKVEDAHLVVAVSRAVHALSLWEDYAKDAAPKAQAAARLTLPRA